jgi:uncharacterized protein (DUF433 family)
MQKALRDADVVPLDVGFYTISEAARLLRSRPKNIARWLNGYAYRSADGAQKRAQPLWRTQLPRHDGNAELDFRDLIELRFVVAFLEHGVGLNVVRRCLETARRILDEERPFATRKFRTDGRTIFLEALAQEGSHAEGVVDLKNNQMAFKTIIEPTFEDLDWDGDVVARWRPYRGRPTIVIDPKRAFGAPVLTDFGIPTGALAASARAEGVERAARLFETSPALVREAVAFETSLMAA